MKNKRIKKFPLRTGLTFVILFLFLFGSSVAFGASPSGVLKQAIHWRISADELDPADKYQLPDGFWSQSERKSL